MTETTRIPQAEDFMTRHVQTVGPEDSLADVANMLITHKLSNVPVVVEEESSGRKSLVGIVSEQDCLEHLSNELFHGRTEQAKCAKHFMTAHPVCVAPQTDLFALTSIFVSHGYRHLPVVDQHFLLGIVSRRDILRAIDAYYREWVIKTDMEHFPPDFSEIMNLRYLPKSLS